MQIAIVGQESVEGKPAYWMEMVMQDAPGKKMVMKELVVLDGENTRVTRMIVQPSGDPPMELPVQMIQQRGHTTEKADIRSESERVGSESITTPAGTFDCDHYRNKQDSAELWISTKVSPYGLVKMTSADANMTLIKVVSDAKSQITGTPQPLNPMMQKQRPE